MVTRAPIALATAGDSGEETTMAAASGTVASPADIGEKSSTSWSCWVTTKAPPSRENIRKAMVPLAPRNCRENISRRSSMGSLAVAWRRKKSASTTSPPRSGASTTPEPHPHVGAEMTPKRTPPMPTVDSTVPGRSARRATGSLDSGTIQATPMSASTTTGTLKTKTAPHQKCSSSTPPSSGPSTMPSAVTAPQRPMAEARSSAEKTWTRIDRVPGMKNDPPTPISPRAAMTCHGSCAKAPSPEAMPKTTRPTTSIFLRPKRSEKLPAVSRTPASTRVYASTNHWSSSVPAPSSRLIVGSATLSTVVSIETTNTARHSTANIAQRRGYPCSISPPVRRSIASTAYDSRALYSRSHAGTTSTHKAHPGPMEAQ